MALKKNKFDFTSDEEKKRYLDEIVTFFQTERGEEIGVIAAEEILTFFIDTFGHHIYEKAINDCKQILKNNTNNLEIELDMLTTR